MSLAKCARCKKLFGRIASRVCPHCQADEDADFAKIHHVIAKNPGMKAESVAIMAGVDLDCVLRMLDEGRLGVVEVSEKPKCGRCGAPAISHAKRLCEHCLAELDRQCAEAIHELKKELPRGGRSKKRRSSGVLSAMREEMEQSRMSEALERITEMEERTHPSRPRPANSVPMVARSVRDKKKDPRK